MSAERYKRYVKDGVTIIDGRPDLDCNFNWGKTRAKKHPPYVFSVVSSAALVHKIAWIDLWWWELIDGGNRMARVNKPKATAHSVCGYTFFLEAAKTRTCIVPNPDALMCGRCHGELPPLGRNGHARHIPRAELHVKLGCVVNGY